MPIAQSGNVAMTPRNRPTSIPPPAEMLRAFAPSTAPSKSPTAIAPIGIQKIDSMPESYKAGRAPAEDVGAECCAGRQIGFAA